MFQNIVICDRCGKKANSFGASYYTITIWGHDINPTNDGRVCAETASQNVSCNMSRIFGKEIHYCKKCKEKIEKFMRPEDNNGGLPRQTNAERLRAMTNDELKQWLQEPSND